MTEQDYKDGKFKGARIMGCRFFSLWLNSRPHYVDTIYGDNRTAFRTLFGKPDFYFKSWNYHHVWIREFHGETFLVFTAKDKGTTIEMIGENFKSIQNKRKVIIAFAKDLYKKLKEIA